MKFLNLLVLLLPLSLGACVTVPPPAVSPAEIASYKLAGVEVQGAQAVQTWPAAQEAYLASGKADPEIAKRLPDEGIQPFPPVQSFVTATLQQRFGQEFGAQVAPLLRGSRPVRIVVTLKTFDIPTGARKALVDSQAKLAATIDILDAKSGEVLVSYPGPMKAMTLGPTLLLGVAGGVGAMAGAAIASGMNGSGEPGATLITGYVADYRKWLSER
jgi:hypothetical protein